MQVWKSVIAIVISVSMFGSMYYLADNETSCEVNAEGPGDDLDEDGRPDEFEIDQGLDETENDVEWTFLVYCCGDDVPAGNPAGTILPEMWEFIEKLSWVGCTDNITIVVQFDGSDVLNGFHQDQYWNNMQNNINNGIIPSSTSTRRFLVGMDPNKRWNPNLNLGTNCWHNTVNDPLSSYTLWDVTNWDPRNTGKAHSSLNWEANMADSSTLFEFISWGMDTFISDNYCLYIDSHGDGVKGFGYDYRPNTNPTTTTKDVLNLSEIKTVSNLLSNENPSKTLDMVMFQSCFMGNLEFCTEFSSFADYYVASENIMHTTGNQDDKVLEQLDLNPSWSPARLAREFIDVEWTYSRDGNSTPPWNITDWATSGSVGLTFSNMNNSYLTTTNLLTQMSIMNTAIQNGVSAKPSWYNSRLVTS